MESKDKNIKLKRSMSAGQLEMISLGGLWVQLQRSSGQDRQLF